MSDESPFVSTFITELKRRKVFRVAGVYAIVAWLIIQIGEATFDALKLPPWALTFIIILLFTGFPIAIIFAWIFDKSPEGKIQLDDQDQDLRSTSKRKRTWFAVGGIIAGIIIGVFFARFYLQTVPDDIEINDKSVAVLPFTPFTISEENQSFADGVHDDILTQLSKIKDLKVISRTSVMGYKNTTKKIQTIAQELNVQHVLEGSVRRAGNQIRIVAQLINAETDIHIWSETYDREYADIFAIQSDVAKKIATALKATLTPKEIDYIDEIPTDNLEAYDYYLKGKHFWDTYSTQEGNQKAADLFTKAIELDPDFTLAYVRASITYSTLHDEMPLGHNREHSKALAKSTLDLAIALSPDHPKVHFAMGVYNELCLDEISAALREYKLAFNGEPNNGEIASYLGDLQWRAGNYKQAEKTLLKSYELNPLDFYIPRNVGKFYGDQREFKKADTYYKLAIQLAPEHAHIYSWLSYVYRGGFGDINKSRSILKEAELSVIAPEELLYSQYWTELYARDFPKALSYAKKNKQFRHKSLILGEAYRYLGQAELARIEFDSLRVYLENKVTEDPESSPLHISLGLVYAYLGFREKAIAEGHKGIELSPAVGKDFTLRLSRLGYLVTIYILTGEYEQAIQQIEYLLSVPSGMTKWRLRLSPEYDPLRENPRFQKLIAED